MKKLFLGLAVLVSVSLVSCKKEAEKAANTAKETAKEVKSTVKDAVSGFDNAKVAEYVKEYNSYIEEYKKAVESKDMTKFQALGQKAQELAKKAQAVSAEGLSENDLKKLQEYTQKQTAKIQELAKKMMQ